MSRPFYMNFPYENAFLWCRVIDAQQDVTVTRTHLDAVNGKIADGTSCMDAKCSLRNRDAFPHPVLAALVYKSVAYFLSKNKPGRATRPAINEVIRYRHYNWKTIKEFDKLGKLSPEERAARIVPNDQQITFHAPGPTVKLGAGKHRNTHVKREKPTTRRRSTGKGFSGRALTVKKYEEGKKIIA